MIAFIIIPFGVIIVLLVAISIRTNIDSKLKTNPEGTGSSSINRKASNGVGNCSVAISYNTKASGGSFHTEGSNTTVSGFVSHAEGINTIASGGRSS